MTSRTVTDRLRPAALPKGTDFRMTRSNSEQVDRTDAEAAKVLIKGLASAVEKASSIVQSRAKKFESFGEYAATVSRASRQSVGENDPRLIRATGLNEGGATSGGFLVPPEVLDGLVFSIYSQSILLPLVDRRESDHPADVRLLAVDEQSRRDGSRSGGAVGFWVSGGDTIQTSFPRFRQIQFAANKLVAAAPVTGELLRDVPALQGFLLDIFGAEFAFLADAAILTGSGLGKPLGVLQSPALIVQPKDSGQATGTVTYSNIINMWSRLAAPCRKSAVWAINQDAEPQLLNMNSGTTPVYLPADSLLGTGYSTLFGRPVIPMESSPVLSAQGDVALIDPSKYLLLDGGKKPAMSLDFSFLNDQAVFRMTWRLDGAPSFASAVTPYNSNILRSPYVALAAR